MARKLFCQICPLTYRISTWKGRAVRRIKDGLSGCRFARTGQEKPLPVLIYKHSSLIRRRLGNVDMRLQENKAVNLSLAAPRVNAVLIRPGETFSFWRLVGNATARRGFRKGLTISNGAPSSGVGGGMCQMTNLIHWMVLHTPLTIVEHHHHDGLDLFPDYGRQLPFGTGTSICYNYLDYRFRNDTQATYQLRVWVDGEYLRGELRADRPQDLRYHIHGEGDGFVRENGVVYRVGQVWREAVDPRTGCGWSAPSCGRITPGSCTIPPGWRYETLFSSCGHHSTQPVLEGRGRFGGPALLSSRAKKLCKI